MKTAFCLIVLAGISLKASAQIEHGTGTLVILKSSQDEIVVAADSRMHIGQKEVDDRCKITALGKELIFTASGTTNFSSPPYPKLNWDAHTIAKNVFRRVSKERANDPLPLRVAKAWGKEIKEKLKADLERDPQETLQSSASNGNTLTEAFFAGFYDGSPFVVAGSITYTIAKNGQISTDFPVDIFKEPTTQMIGEADIGYELLQGRTTRARNWFQDMKARIPKGADSLAFWTIEAMKFSISNNRSVTIGDKTFLPIGGPIDVVRLKPMGGVDWIQRKPNCKD